MHHHEILFNERPTNRPDFNGLLDPDYVNKNTIDSLMSSTEPEVLDKEFKIKFSDWGFKVDRLFEVAYRFYKRNENKAFHLGFDERNRMIALTMQAKFGNFDGSRVPDIGVLDLVGKRRQHEWSLLNGMTKTEAMTKFICELDEICPIFKAHAEAVKISSGIESRSFMFDELDTGQKASIDHNGKTDTSESIVQMPGMYAALCKQTHHQFKAYAQKQHPGEPDKQKHLMASLQEQYYQQYISQLKPKQSERNGNSNVQSNSYSNGNADANNCLGELPPNLKSQESDTVGQGDHAVDHVDKIQELATEVSKSAKKPQDKKANPECLEEPPDNISDINCEDNNVQADISNEELNSEPDPNFNDYSQSDCRPLDVQPQVIKETLNSIAPTIQTESNKPSHKEIMKPGYNPDSHPIAMFESFPEPKLVSMSQRNGAPPETIDPNLPTKTIRHPQENDQAEIKDRSDTSATAMTQQINDVITAGIALEQDQLTSPSRAVLALTQNLVVDTASFSNSNHNDEPSIASDVTDAKIPDNVDLESQVQYEQETPASQQEYQPELWGPISPGGGSRSTHQIPPIDYNRFESASIWTKRAVAEFKDSLGGDKNGGVYEVREGSVVIIQVPTYPEGRYIYWEFATDNHDIGFGVDFVYTEVLTEPLALEIYQDDEDYDEMESPIDVDDGRGSINMVDGCRSEIARERDQSMVERRRRLANRVPILPTYRRDSHEEVQVGRHKYPGRGYYLLRFDNTYSVLRSKTLYFRICYFM